MVKFSPDPLDRTFAALADATRRRILAQLAAAPQLAVSEIARSHAVSLPAVIKHLDVLEGARLLSRRKTGRTVRCTLEAAPMKEAVAWLLTYQRFWSERLDALATFLEDDTWRNGRSATSRASPSGASSRRARTRSSRRGPGPRR
ncbi:MAG TPA: metalloregulator ArsR/SmtB family transcription factor [Hyphomicrobiaceae bacterium]|nr:metalloregulator ArsR/SmtB family transcription factor [Hyphomicrobiaceae bacterium]